MPFGVPKEDWNIVNQEKILPNLLDRIHQLEKYVNEIGYDAKAAKKRRFPSKRQESVLRSLTRALCVETIDPWKENRVRFFHPLLHDPKAKLLSLPFAAPVSAFGGFDDCGVNWVPPAGSTIMLFFEGGSRDAPFYIGTTWHRDRGPAGRDVSSVFPSREWDAIYKDHRAGNFLHGPDDGSQVLPPWNTESYNAGDITQLKQFTEDPNEQKRITYPNIYGFKTPEKHMLKMVDGNAKCNRRDKRIEIMSGCGNWFIMKDDHLHYGGQWAHPQCGVSGDSINICSEHKADLPYFSDIQGKPIEREAVCDNCTVEVLPRECPRILGGHSSTPCEPKTKHCNVQTGSNKFFKQKNECRPYKGPGTPQNNRCDLPQSGMQMLSISGHTMVMDDSVEEPRGKPEWERSLKNFDFGCNNKYLGRFYIKSATGHEFMMSDVEPPEVPKGPLRGKDNFIRLRTACSNSIELNDHTIGEPDEDCPPNYAGELRGITMQTTSNHIVRMIDHMNPVCSPKRTEGGPIKSEATRAFIQIRSGYGLEMRYNDDFSQQQTQRQYIQIYHPQCVKPTTDKTCNSCPQKECRGPHFMRFHGRPKGQPGIVFLRAGGHCVRQVYDMDVILVGDKEKNPSDQFTYVSRKRISVAEDVQYHYTGEMHILFAEKQILLMAGRDCPPKTGSKCKGPCLFNVIVARCPVFCPITGILHWTENSMSERVFASAYHPCQTKCGSGCDGYNSQMAKAKGAPCEEKKCDSTIDIDWSDDDQLGNENFGCSDFKLTTVNGLKYDMNTGSIIDVEAPSGLETPVSVKQ
jgi:hypothetical protein